MRAACRSRCETPRDSEVAELLSRSRPYALKTLTSLESAGIIRRIGKSPKDPRAYWELARG